ncbi:MOSC domain-containing protein [Amycolatopsis minnesotensis]|uniref:MOSC N-terminal beta barrel domain-containing protein n=1 Tax=Amycolatopsis minnesotensis TaxID=337894 RepID=A0ABN2SE16_9PSEU
MTPLIARLFRYPVKGCAGTELREAVVTPAGVEHDRTFMAVGEDGVFRSQRRHPVLAVVRPVLADDGRMLALSAPGVEPLRLPVRFDGPRLPVSVFTWDGAGVDQGDEAAEWFSTVLGAPSRLVRVPPEHSRVTSGETPGTTGFADAHALHVASESSLDHLNSRIASDGGTPVPIDRFRPNIVLSNVDEPHFEDRIRRMAAGSAELAYAKVAIRCPVPMVDQATGRKAGKEPIRTLAGYRREPDGGVSFGIKAAVLRPGQLAKGDEVMVTSWSSESARAAAAEPPLTATASRPPESV